MECCLAALDPVSQILPDYGKRGVTISVPAIFFDNVCKTYGLIRALDHVSLNLHEEEIVCLLGPNGAGKSTAIKLMLGLIPPDSGMVRIFGEAPDSNKARLQIGATPQEMDFPPNLTCREIIRFVQVHYPKKMSENELIGAFGLDGLMDRRVGGFSGGENRRMALALAFCGQGKLIFLDEPTTGLDRESRESFWQFSKRYAHDHGATFVITTHHLSEIEDIATRICLIDKGVIRLDGSVLEIKNRVQKRQIRFKVKAPVDLSHIADFSISQGGYMELTTSYSDDIIRSLLIYKIEYHDLEIIPASLESAIALSQKKEEISP